MRERDAICDYQKKEYDEGDRTADGNNSIWYNQTPKANKHPNEF